MGTVWGGVFLFQDNCVPVYKARKTGGCVWLGRTWLCHLDLKKQKQKPLWKKDFERGPLVQHNALLDKRAKISTDTLQTLVEILPRRANTVVAAKEGGGWGPTPYYVIPMYLEWDVIKAPAGAVCRWPDTRVHMSKKAFTNTRSQSFSFVSH